MGTCWGSTAQTRFPAGGAARVFAQRWDVARQDYEGLIDLYFDWMALDGLRHKAPLVGKKPILTPRTAARGGVKRILLTEAWGIPV